jgi:acyl-CoA synthetase (AMP-forming)/AMP-acid ligase II
MATPGLMQDSPLLLSSMIDYAATFHGDVEIVSRDANGAITRSNYRDTRGRAKQVASALRMLGVQPGDRVASMALNSARHFELYYGACGAGGILNTVNPRLFPDQVAYILDHADNRYLFLDPAFTALVESLAHRLPKIEGYVFLCDRAGMPATQLPNALCYEELLAGQPADEPWTEIPESAGAMLCYTSGTTGDPKGVLYSHRSLALHAFFSTAADGMGLSSRDSVLLVTPLFHVNAWGVPFSAAMCGAKLVFPGPQLDGESIYTLLRDERCTFSLGVPTVWLNFLDFIAAHQERLNLPGLALERVLIGGSAAPRAMIEKFDWLLGVYVIHAWGMTETSPLATVGTPLPQHAALERQARYDIQARQGRAIYGVELKIVDDEGESLPHDGVATGDLKVRGPWVAKAYFKNDTPILDAEGWMATGDVAKIYPDGFLQITDRSKDVIKSGGEWISTIELENAAIGHPEVREAAVIGVAHPKWQERPLMLVVARPGGSPTRESVLAYLSDKVAKFCLPDDVLVVDELPHTATGKLLKTALRQRYRDHLMSAGA